MKSTIYFQFKSQYHVLCIDVNQIHSKIVIAINERKFFFFCLFERNKIHIVYLQQRMNKRVGLYQKQFPYCYFIIIYHSETYFQIRYTCDFHSIGYIFISATMRNFRFRFLVYLFHSVSRLVIYLFVCSVSRIQFNVHFSLCNCCFPHCFDMIVTCLVFV